MSKSEPKFRRAARARAERLYAVPVFYPNPNADHEVVVRATSRAAAVAAAFARVSRRTVRGLPDQGAVGFPSEARVVSWAESRRARA